MSFTRFVPVLAACLAVPTSFAAPDPNDAAKKEVAKLKVENDLAAQRTKQKLQKLRQENDELKAKIALAKSKKTLELARLKQDKEKLDLRNSISAAKHKQALAKLKLESETFKLAHTTALAKLKADKEKLKAKNDVQAEKFRTVELGTKSERSKMSLEFERLKLKNFSLKAKEAELAYKTARYQQSLALRARKRSWRADANKDPEYLAKPYSKGTLVVSDRRISLNGPIFSGVADYVTERIHYFNNKSSKQPIFIVIDKSPGGSVMEGYRIVKAIEKSKAPIHVVVKSFAASMAAVITTLADESYAYPNAIILHHEMSTVTWGNMTQLAEQLELAKRWESRLMGPVAKKIGMSTESFRKGMYKNNSDGDWMEFADKARKLRWVKHIVHEIRETGVVAQPKEQRRRSIFWLDEKRDERGQRYVELPRLHPMDLYFIHNPDKYYR